MYRIQPVFKDYIWGGQRLKEAYGKVSDLEKVAESWELSTHPAGTCKVIIDGTPVVLDEYIKKRGKAVLGTKAKSDNLSILIKLIDAKDNLSVQVHPDDAYAMAHEHDLGKTEMWYVLEAEEGAQLVYGFKKDLTKEAFKASIENNTLCDDLNYVNVHKGDVFFITPGTMHAIGKGIVIAEIQESSNVTYRVYDYGRLGKDGRPRELHVAKALEVTKLSKAADSARSYEMKQQEGAEVGTLASCDYFDVKRIDVTSEITLEADQTSFQHLLVAAGDMKFETADEIMTGHKGDSFFVAAGEGRYKVRGKGELILSAL